MPGTMFSRSAAVALVALASMAAYAAPAQAQQADASGEVRRVDTAKGRVAIKHGPIGDLQLPAMTLVYRVDPVLLEGIVVGDSVKFTATRQNGEYVIIKLSR